MLPYTILSKQQISTVRRETSAMALAELDCKTSLSFVPPRIFWERPIQDIRCFHDKAFLRWPPHINLLYPFWKDTDDHLEKAAQAIRRKLASWKPFRLTFRRFNYFGHGHSCTVWLEPESESLCELQFMLTTVFPECHHLNDDPSRNIEKFVPHLSVGQWSNREAAEEAISQLSLSFEPMEITVDSLMILHRSEFLSPFEFRFKIPFGAKSDTEIEALNIPYVASLGADETICRKFPYGLGSYTEGVWNFAYGANVSLRKVVHSRKLTPLESVPGFLKGYKMSFNNQGGMGNVEKMTSDAESLFRDRGISGVHGILYRFSHVDFTRLTNMEYGYYPIEMEVEAQDGRIIRAVVYRTPNDHRIKDDLPVPDRYIQLIVKGAKEWNLDTNYIQWLESLETTFKNRGALYWKSAEGKKIPEPIVRIGSKPPRKDFNN